MVPFDPISHHVEDNQGGLIQNEPHDHDGCGVADLNSLGFQGIYLHDLTAARAGGDIAIELADKRCGNPLVEFVLPGVQTAENPNDEAIHGIRKKNDSDDNQDVPPVGFGESIDDGIEFVAP